jgi:hypothetical protein
MQKATGVSIRQFASRVVQRRAEASTREPIDGCRMAIGPLPYCEQLKILRTRPAEVAESPVDCVDLTGD